MVIPMLFVWTLTGLLLTLEPCCEFLAFSAAPAHAAAPTHAAAPGEAGHEHAAAEHLTSHGHDAGLARTHGEGGSPHSHCKPVDNPLEGAPVIASVAPGSTTDAPKVPAVDSGHLAGRLVAINAFAISRLHHPPSFRLHYLRTQRLRI